MKFDNDIKITILVFSILSFILYYLKPSFMFHNDGRFKDFGITHDKTIYPLWLVLLVSGIITYLVIIIKKDEYI